MRCSNSGFVWLQHAVAGLALVPASLAALTAGAGSRAAMHPPLKAGRHLTAGARQTSGAAASNQPHVVSELGCP